MGCYLQWKSSLIIVPISGIKFVEINFCTSILHLISSEMIVTGLQLILCYPCIRMNHRNQRYLQN